MEKFSKTNLLLLCIAVVGLSLAVIGCSSGGDSSPSTPVAPPSDENERNIPTALISDTVSLTANSRCWLSGTFYCVIYGLTPNEAGKQVTISVQNVPSNLRIKIDVYDPLENFLVSNQEGVNNVSFVPTQTGTHYVEVYDSNRVGGTVTVVAQQ